MTFSDKKKNIITEIMKFNQIRKTSVYISIKEKQNA